MTPARRLDAIALDDDEEEDDDVDDAPARSRRRWLPSSREDEAETSATFRARRAVDARSTRRRRRRATAGDADARDGDGDDIDRPFVARVARVVHRRQRARECEVGARVCAGPSRRGDGDGDEGTDWETIWLRV